MKHLLGIASALVLAVVFLTPLAIAAPQDPVVKGSDLMFPTTGISSWQYASANMNVSVHIGEVVVQGRTYNSLVGGEAIFGVAAPFLRWRVGPQGEVFSDARAVNGKIRADFLAMAERDSFFKSVPKDIQEKWRNSWKFSSDEWLLLPATLQADGCKWEVVRYSYINLLTPKEVDEFVIMGRAGGPSQSDLTNGDTRWVVHLYEYIGWLDQADWYYHSMVIQPQVGITVYRVGDNSGNLPADAKAKLVGTQTGQAVNPSVGKTATTWGKIKAAQP